MNSIHIEDLLARVPIHINTTAISKSLDGKCILVTGAAGSIGSEIVRQIGQFNPGLLLLCDIAESPLHELGLELQENFSHLKFISLISDVRNAVRMEQILSTYRPQYVYHAAAYKHVPMMEDQPSECVLTNVLGTKVVADLSIKYEVDVFVMISTDKAVNPSNVMGATKRIAEIYVQSLNEKQTSADKKTRFNMTRFGNVLGSSGSVIPRFREQIQKGGPLTVTHPDIVRYFMTVEEACQLVLEAGNMGEGGEIFVFDMGEPVKIVDLAEKMVRLAGYQPYKDIDIVFTGLRPGEKLFEELLTDDESVRPTYHEKIMIAIDREYPYEIIYPSVDKLVNTAQLYKENEVVRLMKEIVPEYVNGHA